MTMQRFQPSASYSIADPQVVSNLSNQKRAIELQDLAAIIAAVLLPYVPTQFFEIPLAVTLPDLSASYCSSSTLE